MKGTIIRTEALPTGEYPVTVTDVEDAEGSYGPQIKLTLEVVGDGPYMGKRVFAWAAANLSTKSKLAHWVRAFGFAFEVGANFDTDILVGANATAVVLRKSRDNGDGDFNLVEDIQSSNPDPF